MNSKPIILAALSYALAACGPSEPPSQDFVGKWYGTASVATDGGQPFTYNGTLTIGLGVGNVLDVAGVCLNGTGRVAAPAEGRTAGWGGTVTCPWFPGPACNSATVTFSGGLAEVTESGTLVVTSRGTFAGCGVSAPIALTYYARK